MRFDDLQIQALQSQQLQKYTEQSYCVKAADAIATMIAEGPDTWKYFGPYWPQAQALLLRYRPDLAQRVKEWGDPPDYLAAYSYGSDMLNAIAALQYLSVNGDHLAPIGSPHSIELPSGDQALYTPGVGLIEQ
jgi:hypothetical protein